MKKYVLASLSSILLLLLLLSPVYAQTAYRQGDTVYLAKNETITGDYFAAGGTITISGTVNGDVYVAGGNVIIDGIVTGDLLAAGGTIIVQGNIAKDIRIAGGNVTITAPVGGNISVVGGNITITQAATVTGSVAAAGGNLHITAPVGKDVSVAGGNVTLDTTVSGNVASAADQLTLGPTAKIAGNLTYLSTKQARLEPGAEVAGKTVHNVPPKQPTPKPKPEEFLGIATSITLVLKIIGFISTFILGSLLIWFMPNYSLKTSNLIAEKPWTCLGIGFLTLVLTPIATVLLLISVIGIPIALLLMAALFILFMIAKIFVAMLIGQKIFVLLNQKAPLLLALLIGLITLEIISIIPVVGFITSFIVTLLGLGAYIIQEKMYYILLRKRGEI